MTSTFAQQYRLIKKKLPDIIKSALKKQNHLL